jgi:hypothetical protein
MIPQNLACHQQTKNDDGDEKQEDQYGYKALYDLMVHV